jgi:hypothetical protein
MPAVGQYTPGQAVAMVASNAEIKAWTYAEREMGRCANSAIMALYGRGEATSQTITAAQVIAEMRR